MLSEGALKTMQGEAEGAESSPDSQGSVKPLLDAIAGARSDAGARSADAEGGATVDDVLAHIGTGGWWRRPARHAAFGCASV